MRIAVSSFPVAPLKAASLTELVGGPAIFFGLFFLGRSFKGEGNALEWFLIGFSGEFNCRLSSMLENTLMVPLTLWPGESIAAIGQKPQTTPGRKLYREIRASCAITTDKIMSTIDGVCSVERLKRLAADRARGAKS